MKVAIITGEIPAPTFVERLITGLSESGIEIIQLGKKNGSLPKRNNVVPIGPSKKLEPFSKRLLKFRYQLLLKIFKNSLYQQLQKCVKNPKAEDFTLAWHKPDIVHIQWAKTIESYLWVQELGMKLVLSLRGAHINYSPIASEELAQSYYRAFPKVDGFHGVSKTICTEATKYGADINKCKVVYSGLNLSLFPSIENKESWGNKKLNIVSVGRAHWKKGYHIALDALKTLKDNGVEFNYEIVGIGIDEELLFQKNQLQLNDYVHFGEKQSFNKVLNSIKNADVLLLPSVEEGIANVAIESMLLGTLVVSTNCGGMKELITNKETGYIVPIRDSQAISNCLQSITNKDVGVINAIRNAAYKKACAQHNQEKMVNDMLDLYQNVIQS